MKHLQRLLLFVTLTEQQLPQQVLVVRLASERTPPEEALMIQSVHVTVPLHHHIARLLGARKTPTSGNRVPQTRLRTVCGHPATAAARAGQGSELSERSGLVRCQGGRERCLSRTRETLDRASRCFSRQAGKANPNLCDRPLNCSQVAESRRRGG